MRQNAEGVIKEMSPDQAIEEGALALFGGKYGDRVRVLRLGDALDNSGKGYSVELCGGTHVKRTGDIAVFAIPSESGVASGVRRIEGVTGAAALAYLKAQAAIAKTAAFNSQNIFDRGARPRRAVAGRSARSSNANCPRRARSWRWQAMAAARRVRRAEALAACR